MPKIGSSPTSARSTRSPPKRCFRPSAPIRLMLDAISRPGRSSATPTSTPRSLSTPARSALGSARATPIASPRARRSSLRRDSRRNCRGRSIFSSSPITPTTWGSSRTCWPASPDILADPTGRQWYDMIQSGKGADAAIEIIVAFSQGTFPAALVSLPGTPAYRPPGRRRSRRPRRPTIRAASPLSSATSGRRIPAATICTAT